MTDPIYENLNALYKSALSEDFLDDPERLVEDIINLHRVYRHTPTIPVADVQTVVDTLKDWEHWKSNDLVIRSCRKLIEQLLPDNSAKDDQP
jgi:hypothetical protein